MILHLLAAVCGGQSCQELGRAHFHDREKTFRGSVTFQSEKQLTVRKAGLTTIFCGGVLEVSFGIHHTCEITTREKPYHKGNGVIIVIA